MTAPLRPTVAEVDLDAVRANVSLLAAHVAPAELWAVVKADGYGHGAVPVARAALAGGARALAVALVAEGIVLREAGIVAPVLVLSQPTPAGIGACAANGLTPTICTPEGVAAAARAGVPAVHVKVDTGMHRMGVAPGETVDLCRSAQRAGVTVAALWTHLAAADDPATDLTDQQLACFERVRAELAAAGLEPPAWHAANSAAALIHHRAHGSAVRCGITVYGLEPAGELADRCTDLQPALSLRSAVSAVRRIGPGEGVSYGHRFVADRAMTVATVPIGYADGVPRRFHQHGRVLIGGRPRPVTGVVTMDQLMVCCDDDPVEVGDEVVLIGQQEQASITVADWARWLGTITYEVTCALTSRVPRHYREVTT